MQLKRKKKKSSTNPQVNLNNSRTENTLHTQPCEKITPINLVNMNFTYDKQKKIKRMNPISLS